MPAPIAPAAPAVDDDADDDDDGVMSAKLGIARMLMKSVGWSAGTGM
jgi:hypothetical protein